MKIKNISPFYANTKDIPFASKISFHVRTKIFNFFMEVNNPNSTTKVLDVGVTSDDSFQESNFFEKHYPYIHNVTCAGTEDGSYLEKRFNGLKFVRVESGRSLPFQDREFDIVFSNAVIEHAGSRKEQIFFAEEICRVSKNFFVATPNRWFPFEAHTGLPFLHFLPAVIFRNIIKNSRYKYWSYEKNLNLLGLKSFKTIFPSVANIKTKKIQFCGFTSNLIVYTYNTGDGVSLSV